MPLACRNLCICSEIALVGLESHFLCPQGALLEQEGNIMEITQSSFLDLRTCFLQSLLGRHILFDEPSKKQSVHIGRPMVGQRRGKPVDGWLQSLVHFVPHCML
jgi:hypothetical protein